MPQFRSNIHSEQIRPTEQLKLRYNTSEFNARYLTKNQTGRRAYRNTAQCLPQMKTVGKYCLQTTADLIQVIPHSCGPGSVVGIATGYRLDGPEIESWWGRARFSAPVQTGPGAHPDSCTIGTWVFLGVKSGRCVTLTPHPLLVSWSELYHYSPYGPYGLYRAPVPVQG
jgi:hypothetical protein